MKTFFGSILVIVGVWTELWLGLERILFSRIENEVTIAWILLVLGGATALGGALIAQTEEGWLARALAHLCCAACFLAAIAVSLSGLTRVFGDAYSTEVCIALILAGLVGAFSAARITGFEWPW